LRGDKSFDPGTEWLYVQYKPYSDLKLRVGRVVMPAFLYSDVINVGYAVPWFRAPNEIYDSLPFDYIDGAQIQWQHAFGPVQLGAEFSYGDASATFKLSGIELPADSKNTVNGAIWLSWGNLLVRYAQTDLRTGLDFALGPQLQVNTSLSDYFHCYGLQYDNGRALFMSEWIKRNEDSLEPFGKPVGVERGWYVAAGWRFGKLTPLATYSTLNLLDSLITPPASYHTWGASLRYDVVQNLDLKIQVNRAMADNGTYWTTPQYTQDRINVYSLGADFVF
ncbi:MAG TPA: hypothetical protein VHZ99_11680, partial [Steroidobacteraceae bacterium]|nr:hypothetical protein [Steroidobacteraceae bacterium]